MRENMEYQIRKMTKEDCEAVTHVITIAWNESYRGIVPDDFLDRMYLNEKERAENSRRGFDDNDSRQFVLEADHRIAGYMNAGLTDDSEYKACGEIFAVYLLKEYKSHGFGREMIGTGIKELRKMGCDKMLIGCLAGNPANGFYEHIGGRIIKQRIFERLQLSENVYYFALC